MSLPAWSTSEPFTMPLMNIGQLVSELCAIETPEEAALYRRVYAEMQAREMPASIERGYEVADVNIGYVAGYMSGKDAARVLSLFKTEHPIFGKMQEVPTNATA